MDERAHAVKIDPLELRLRNYAETDEDRGKPFSSKALRACYLQAAERFGWTNRTQSVRRVRSGDLLLGWGMASATFTVKLSAASARVELHADGTATVLTASHDLHRYIHLAAAVAQHELGIAPSRVDVKLGDTALPSAPASAGSQTAPAFDPQLHWSDLLKSCENTIAEAEAHWTPTPIDKRTWSAYAFGVHFCEVAVDEGMGNVTVRRWVAALPAGHILNEKTARSQ